MRRFGSEPIFANKVLVSGGFFDNFWHAMFIFNAWCELREEKDMKFVVQPQNKAAPKYVYEFATAMVNVMFLK